MHRHSETLLAVATRKCTHSLHYLVMFSFTALLELTIAFKVTETRLAYLNHTFLIIITTTGWNPSSFIWMQTFPQSFSLFHASLSPPVCAASRVKLCERNTPWVYSELCKRDCSWITLLPSTLSHCSSALPSAIHSYCKDFEQGPPSHSMAAHCTHSRPLVHLFFPREWGLQISKKWLHT